MAGDLVLPVPDQLTGSYLVPVTIAPRDVVASAKGASPGDDAGPDVTWAEIERLVAEGSCQVGELPAADVQSFPLELCEAFGAAADDLAATRAATAFVVVHVTAPPAWPFRHDRVARTLAARIAEHVGAPVLDPSRKRLLPPTEFIGAAGDDDRFARWVTVLMSGDRNGLWVTTTGLGRFGLPELQALSVPHHLAPVLARVMTGIAHALVRAWCARLEQQPDAAFVAFPRRLEVTPHDVTSASEPAGPMTAAEVGTGVTVELALDPSMIDRDSFLTVTVPVDGFDAVDGIGPKGKGRTRTGAKQRFVRLCQHLVGAVPEPCAAGSRSRSPAVALERLRPLRPRFLAGEFSEAAGKALLVKARLPAPQEDLWFLVDAWRTPERIAGGPERNARRHPAVREGRLIEFPIDYVIDWAVMTDDGVTLEHAWAARP